MCKAIDRYLEKNNITKTQFSKKLGIPYATLHRIINGKFDPSKNIKIKIYIATNGAVTPNDFYDLPLLESERSQLDFFKPAFHPPSFPESQTHNPQQTECQPCPAV